MRGSDIFLFILIIIIFTLLITFNQASATLTQLKEQWPLIRCNPLAMPFASAFGADTTENFTYCVQDMQTKYMSYLLQPLNYNFGVIGNIASSITESLEGVRNFISNLRTFISDIVGGIFAVFLNILIEVQRLTINIKDMNGKLVGIMATIMFTLDGSVKTMQSTWGGPPGQLVRGLCFYPDTKVMLKNGEIVMMKDIPLNAVLQNGAVVRSVLKISNIDTNGKHIEKLYIIKDGVDGSYIFVTGSHRILDPNTNTFVRVKDYRESIETDVICDELACLITSDHTIQIGKRIFDDWEENTHTHAKQQ
jgi:hypothetical protein